ncbi:gag/pol protein [Cucumis melo var. makuwa]|uniref:Gag/pol protein n=1 Tax=Cucumis melo var. makuwa TaxID=1194695 RepID=A0A5D3DR18_CUCMM|nr:gag/pol protein [Cucumis melo var. makuwa]
MLSIPGGLHLHLLDLRKFRRGKGKGPTIAAEGTGKAKVAIKGKCFHCNVDGHWKRNCPKYLAKKKEKEGKYDLLELETCLVENDQNSWILDSRATNHVCSSLQKTRSFKHLEEGEMTLKVGIGDVISARAVGDAKLGHINLDRIGRLVKNGLLNELEDHSLPPCESCLEGKMIKRPFTGKRYGYLYLMEHKSEALEKFKEYKAEVENLLSKKIKILRSDRGGEYMDLRFQDYIIEHGIQSQPSAPGTPQQNGVSERRNRTLLDMSTGFSSKPGGFLVFSDALSIQEVHKSNQKLYLEIDKEWPRGNRPGLQTGELDKIVIFPLSTLSVLRDNDAVVEIELPLPDTLPTSAESSGSNSSTWLELYFESVHVEMLFYKPSDARAASYVCWEGSAGIVRGDDVCWLHAIFRAKTAGGPGGGVTPSKSVSETPFELWRGRKPSSSHFKIWGCPADVLVTNPKKLEPPSSGRVVSQPNRYLGLTETQVVIPDDGVEDPLSYKQAMNDVDKDQWVKAMDFIDPLIPYMYFNSVWELVDLPEGVKPIGYKWIYKRKRDSAGKSIRILLSLATFYDYEIWQMDVKTAFLNGNLEESIFMSQPEGFITQVGIVSRTRDWRWTVVKIILKYLKRTRDYMLVYGAKDLILTEYTDSDFQTYKDSRKYTLGSVITLNEGAVVWRSIKQGCIADSTMEAEYVAACEAAKEAVWLKKFLHDLEVVPNMNLSITLYCDNSGVVANSKEPRSHKRGKHIERKYHRYGRLFNEGM